MKEIKIPSERSVIEEGDELEIADRMGRQLKSAKKVKDVLRI